jgi:hypothetical protein
MGNLPSQPAEDLGLSRGLSRRIVLAEVALQDVMLLHALALLASRQFRTVMQKVKLAYGFLDQHVASKQDRRAAAASGKQAARPAPSRSTGVPYARPPVGGGECTSSDSRQADRLLAHQTRHIIC